MLLRLLPIPSPSQPTPPTILFTLPLPTHPYTSRSLPLPPNLLAHRSVCLQEAIDCPNVLLGEKSSWLSGVIDDVTFSLPTRDVTVALIDGSILKMALSDECINELRRVIHEVQLSFAPEAQTPRASVSSTRSRASSASSSCSSTYSHASSSSPLPRRRSPSALLMSILSPLLPIGQSAQTSFPSPPPQPPARIHRRQARSLLVDTYRRHVLPFVKDTLPGAYLPWAIASETSRHMSDFERVKDEINDLLATAGIETNMSTPMKRSRSSSTSSSATDSDSDSDPRSPVTPATSVFSPCPSPSRSRTYVTPSSFLHAIPPAQAIPISHRNAYGSQLARLSAISGRLSSIKKLQARYEREEGKRKWLESLERGRQGDKGLRRAFSNGLIQPRIGVDAKPIKRSGLWRSWTAGDQARAERQYSHPVHPAMAMDLDEDSPYAHFEDADSASSTSDDYPTSASSLTSRRRSSGSGHLPNLPDLTLEDGDEPMMESINKVQHSILDAVANGRPPLKHRDADADVNMSHEESYAVSKTPTRPRQVAPAAAPIGLGRFGQWGAGIVSMSAPSVKSAEKRLPSLQWDNGYGDHEDRPELEDPRIRVEVYGGVEVVFAT